MRQRTKLDELEAQSRKFIDKARELGCDDDEAKLDERLRRIAKKPERGEKAPTKK